MVQQMDALEERGVSFTTMSVAGEIDAETDRSPVDYIRTVPEIIREAGNGYDLIHAHYGLTGPIALAQLRKPVVLSLWGSDVHGPVAPVSRASAPLCDEVVVMSGGDARSTRPRLSGDPRRRRPQDVSAGAPGKGQSTGRLGRR